MPIGGTRSRLRGRLLGQFAQLLGLLCRGRARLCVRVPPRRRFFFGRGHGGSHEFGEHVVVCVVDVEDANRAKLPALLAAFSTSTTRPSTTAAADVAIRQTSRQQFDFEVRRRRERGRQLLDRLVTRIDARRSGCSSGSTRTSNRCLDRLGEFVAARLRTRTPSAPRPSVRRATRT